MQISNVQNFTAQNFKGLWGNSHLREYSDDRSMIDSISTTIDYYPFKDEKEENIEKTKREYILDEISPKVPNSDEYRLKRTQKVNVQKPLDFTETEYYKAQATRYQILIKKEIPEETKKQTEPVIKTVDKMNLTEKPKNPRSIYGCNIILTRHKEN